MTNPLLDRLRQSQIQAAEATRFLEQIGGFMFLRHPSQKLRWLNQTVPLGPCTSDDLDRLIVRYRETDREPFFEFCPELSPEVPQLLEAAGFACTLNAPILAIAKENWKRGSIEELARTPVPDELGAALAVAAEAFGSTEIEDGAVQALQDSIDRGSILVSVGISEERVVAMGQAVGTPEVREIAGIATHHDYRRRGYAGAVIRCLLSQFFPFGGDIAWLTPGHDEAESLYRQLGFVDVGTHVSYFSGK